MRSIDILRRVQRLSEMQRTMELPEVVRKSLCIEWVDAAGRTTSVKWPGRGHPRELEIVRQAAERLTAEGIEVDADGAYVLPNGVVLPAGCKRTEGRGWITPDGRILPPDGIPLASYDGLGRLCCAIVVRRPRNRRNQP